LKQFKTSECDIKICILIWFNSALCVTDGGEPAFSLYVVVLYLEAGPCQPGGGGRSTLCFRKQKFPKSFATQHVTENSIIQRTNPSFFTNFAIPACQGPSPASRPPFFYFLLPSPLPPPPPHTHTSGGTALCRRKEIKKYSLLKPTNT
jgi:hypothetical protein